MYSRCSTAAAAPPVHFSLGLSLVVSGGKEGKVRATGGVQHFQSFSNSIFPSTVVQLAAVQS